MDLRLRMVLLGLIAGVVFAIVVAAQGCGDHSKPVRHGVHPEGRTPLAHSRGSPAAKRKPLRRPNARGAFFSWRSGHSRRFDAPTGRRVVALTFDDGPGIGTQAILAELRRMHAPATFFVLGSMAAARPDVVRAEQSAGMQVANHTWSHTALPTLSAAAQRDELSRTQRLLEQLTGRRPRFFRPPNWRFGERTARVAAGLHLTGVMRTVDTRDWTLPGIDEIVRRALSVEPGGVVAMHDGGGLTRAQTVAAVPRIVSGLRRRGLRLVTVAELYGR